MNFQEFSPSFVHSCDHCRFLGHRGGFDLYVCPVPDHGILVRWGDSPYSSSSGQEMSLDSGTTRALEMAYEEALRCGWVVSEPPDFETLAPVVEVALTEVETRGCEQGFAVLADTVGAARKNLLSMLRLRKAAQLLLGRLSSEPSSKTRNEIERVLRRRTEAA
jgi:hypothetical protein